MSNGLVLITGATGHLGFRTLRAALEHGYHVRAAVRSEQKATNLRSNPVLQNTRGYSNLTFTIVPDFLVPNAFDDAARDVNSIIHVASPLVTKAPASASDLETHFIQPAVRGTLAIFESARKTSTVRRIVITSSVIAIQPLSAFASPDPTVYTAENRLPEIEGPITNPGAAYAASKIAALNRAEAWLEAEKPPFDVVHIHPSFIFGRDDLAARTGDFQTGTNRIPLNVVLGSGGDAMPNNFNSVDDTAEIHVRALDPAIQGGQSFIVSNSGMDGMRFDDAKEIVARRFPEAVKNGDLPNNGSNPSVVSKFDASKTEKTFRIKFASYEDVVVSVVGHYLELLEKEGKEEKN